MTEWINVILQGVLIGGLYAMFAAGLSLIFGVMRLVNIAHGDLIVLAAYVALMVTQGLGIDPLTSSLLLVVPIMALIGYALQRGLLNFTLGEDMLPPLLVTFGLSIIIQNGLLELFTADSRKLQRRRHRDPDLPGGARHLDRRAAADPVRRRGGGHLAACRCCSTAPRSAAPSAPPPTTSRWRSSWASTPATSSPWRWRCRWRSSPSPACSWRCAPISTPRSARRG